ncbi:hypothetical protein VIGAN_01119100 [Vigna angularis var. angularis]|uniref:Uncharacterized protein n=1 Tax=Vigna angularis var. angularis TaxID=157739 RepID=A0A0S3QZE5_PHAAN|nr:hypothetical protein VIGAN_01119100 [Vigna angularis var. angularis]
MLQVQPLFSQGREGTPLDSSRLHTWEQHSESMGNDIEEECWCARSGVSASSNKAFTHLKKKHPNHHLTSMGGAHLRELL